MMNIIRREKYLSKVSPYIGKDLIKVLIGSRRVGKTYIMLQIMDDINKNDEAANIIYINKEQYEFKSISNDEQLYQYVTEHLKNKKNNYLFVDEVQEIERFELVLRQLLLKNIDIYCTGSNARMLSSDLAEISGRYEVHDKKMILVKANQPRISGVVFELNSSNQWTVTNSPPSARLPIPIFGATLVKKL